MATVVSGGGLVAVLERDRAADSSRETALVARDPVLVSLPEARDAPPPSTAQPTKDGSADAPVVVPESGKGSFRTAPPARPTDRQPLDEPAGSEQITTYVVQVEDGLPFTPRAFARTVDLTLSDQRGWSVESHRLLRSTGADSSDVRVVLASPDTADSLCAPLLTRGRLSCRNGRDVVINAWRWAHGAPSYDDDLGGYRSYLINHEVGHALGYGHRDCPGEGARAPVMVQQTKGLDGCRANPWPALAS